MATQLIPSPALTQLFKNLTAAVKELTEAANRDSGRDEQLNNALVAVAQKLDVLASQEGLDTAQLMQANDVLPKILEQLVILATPAPEPPPDDPVVGVAIEKKV